MPEWQDRDHRRPVCRNQGTARRFLQYRCRQAGIDHRTTIGAGEKENSRGAHPLSDSRSRSCYCRIRDAMHALRSMAPWCRSKSRSAPFGVNAPSTTRVRRRMPSVPLSDEDGDKSHADQQPACVNSIAGTRQKRNALLPAISKVRSEAGQLLQAMQIRKKASSEAFFIRTDTKRLTRKITS